MFELDWAGSQLYFVSCFLELFPCFIYPLVLRAVVQTLQLLYRSLSVTVRSGFDDQTQQGRCYNLRFTLPRVNTLFSKQC